MFVYNPHSGNAPRCLSSLGIHGLLLLCHHVEQLAKFVTSENNSYATKEPTALLNVLQSPINGLKNEAIAHGDLINDEKLCLPKELSCSHRVTYCRWNLP